MGIYIAIKGLVSWMVTCRNVCLHPYPETCVYYLLGQRIELVKDLEMKNLFCMVWVDPKGSHKYHKIYTQREDTQSRRRWENEAEREMATGQGMLISDRCRKKQGRTDFFPIASTEVQPCRHVWNFSLQKWKKINVYWCKPPNLCQFVIAATENYAKVSVREIFLVME